MTDTTATTGTSTGKVEAKPADDHAPSVKPHGPEGAAPSAASEDVATGRAAETDKTTDSTDITRTGGAGDGDQPTATGSPSGAAGDLPVAGSSGDRPAFTRPPGMSPPPVELDDKGAEPRKVNPGLGVPAGGIRVSPSGSYPVVTGTAPVSSPPRGVSRPASGVTVRPISAGAAVGSARVSEAVRPGRSAPTPRGPRRARLGVKRIDPWSVMKFSFAVSLVLFIVVIVAASVLYLALDTMGVFASINSTLGDLVESGGGAAQTDTFQITARGVIGTAAVLGAINVVLFTAMATLSAFVYNVCADLVGGVELTLAERD